MEKCSFCDKTGREVAGLIERSDKDASVAICNECVSLCLIQLSKLVRLKQRDLIQNLRCSNLDERS